MDSKDVFDHHLSKKQIDLNSKAILNIERRLIWLVNGLVGLSIIIFFLNLLRAKQPSSSSPLDFLFIGLILATIPLIFIRLWRTYKMRITQFIPISLGLYMSLIISLFITYTVAVLELFIGIDGISSILCILKEHTTFHFQPIYLIIVPIILVSTYQFYAYTYLVIGFIKFRRSQKLSKQ
ncbi:MAG: hypothetical protein MK212_04700 [Saprospiraceae bacterium]|nr:hypothetical protein [Saprospiraceae bacterium]